MPWTYTAVSIRLVPKHRTWPEHAVSGIYLVSAENGASDLCLTIFHVPVSEIRSRYNVFISAPQLAPKDDVFWTSAEITQSAPLFRPEDPLRDSFQQFKSSGFDVVPSDTTTHGFTELNVAVLSCKPFFRKETASSFVPFSVGATQPSGPISIRAFPFSFTSSRLFADFRASGTVTATLASDNVCHAFLCDTKYLENMIGGAATAESGACVGLLAGSLRKRNGDGELSVIVSWERLVAQLSRLKKQNLQWARRPALAPLSGSPAGHTFQSERPVLQAASSVLPVVLSRDNCRFMWGSCVRLNSQTLVTNHHIISVLESDAVQCHVLVNETPVELSKKDKVVVPYEGLDLAFVVLSPETQAHLSAVKAAKMTLSQFVSPASPVYAVGYGLYLDAKNAKPLVSRGFISRLVSMAPFPGSGPTPCLLAASASCWNGSSGGGLFTETGSLIGVICSNAQVFMPSVDGVQTKTEKVPQVCFSIPLELILECYRLKVEQQTDTDLDAKVAKAWRLEKYHEDVFERELKL